MSADDDGTLILSVTIANAAKATGYSTDVIRAAIGRGEITARYGASTKPVIRVPELERWLDSLPTERWN